MLELRAQRADAAFGHEVRHERDEVLDRYLDGRLADGGCGRRYAHLAREHLKDLVEAPAAATKKDSAAS